MKRFMRILALAMLAALVVSTLPAMAATKGKTPSIVSETLYAGTSTYYMTVKNWSWEAKDVVVTSSNPGVLKVNNRSQFSLTPKKAGKAKITVKFKLNGKVKKISKTFTVKKYPNAIKSLKINDHSVKLTGEDRLRHYENPDYDDETCTVSLVPGDGWTLASVKSSGYDAHTGEKRAAKIKNDTAFPVSDFAAVSITYTLKKGKETFKYTVNVERDCY